MSTIYKDIKSFETIEATRLLWLLCQDGALADSKGNKLQIKDLLGLATADDVTIDGETLRNVLATYPNSSQVYTKTQSDNNYFNKTEVYSRGDSDYRYCRNDRVIFKAFESAMQGGWVIPDMGVNEVAEIIMMQLGSDAYTDVVIQLPVAGTYNVHIVSELLHNIPSASVQNNLINKWVIGASGSAQIPFKCKLGSYDGCARIIIRRMA